MTKNLNETEALYCANIFNNYFGKFDRIDQYMRDQKLAQIENVPAPLPGMGFDTGRSPDIDYAMVHEGFINKANKMIQSKI